MPYIMGIDEGILPLIKNQLDENAENDNIVYIVNIKKNLIEVNMQQKLKKVTKKILFQNIHEYPENVYDNVAKDLKELKKAVDRDREANLLNNEKMSKKMRSIFVKAFSCLIGDYKKYVSVIGSLPLFNTESFLLLKSKKDKSFYSELVSTQIFNNLIQSNETFAYFDKICLRYKETQITSRKLFSDKTRSNSVSRSAKKSLTKINSKTPCKALTTENSEISKFESESETYIITPYFMEPILFNRIDNAKLDEFIATKYNCKIC
jgi:hypothetical protein